MSAGLTAAAFVAVPVKSAPTPATIVNTHAASVNRPAADASQPAAGLAPSPQSQSQPESAPHRASQSKTWSQASAMPAGSQRQTPPPLAPGPGASIASA